MHDVHSHSTRRYTLTFLALLVLLGITVALAFADFGRLSIAIALSIAIIKGLLIILDFMHVRTSAARIWLFAIAGFVWLGIMVTLTMSDYVARPGSSHIGPVRVLRY